MSQIYTDYKILNPPSFANPNDVISGIFYIRNEGKKEKNIKKIEIQCQEAYKYYDTSYHNWRDKTNTLSKLRFVNNLQMLPGESKEIPFQIKLPRTWSPKSGGGFKDWHIALIFNSKTLLYGDKAYCVLPVKGSTRPPSFTSPNSNLGLENQQQAPQRQTQTQNVVINVSKDNSLLDSEKKQHVEMKFCSLCGKKIKEKAIFCEFCGGKQ